MSRFMAGEPTIIVPKHGSMPNAFSNVYAVRNGNDCYINLTSSPDLDKHLTQTRRIHALVDMSGGVRDMYRETGLLTKKPSAIQNILSDFTRQVSPFIDGYTLTFYSDGIIQSSAIRAEGDIAKMLSSVISKPGAFRGSKPVICLESIVDGYQEPVLVLIVTDGAVDDNAVLLRRYYESVLHRELGTREHMYCCVLEYGQSLEDGFASLHGLYPPVDGREDIFDVYHVSKTSMASVLAQIVGMSALATSVNVEASISSGQIEVINTDLFPSGTTHATSTATRTMSLRIRPSGPFDFTLSVEGFQPVFLRGTPTNTGILLEEREVAWT